MCPPECDEFTLKNAPCSIQKWGKALFRVVGENTAPLVDFLSDYKREKKCTFFFFVIIVET